MRPRMKICGLTNYEDAALAAELGADYLGFVLAPSPRRIAPEALSPIVERLREEGLLARARTVGVFVNEEPARMAAILERCGLDLAQIHGDEGPEDCERLGFAWYRALRVATAQEGRELASMWCASSSPFLLFDAASRGTYGGTGTTIGLEAALASRDLTRIAGKLFFLAGGLDPENIAELVAAIEPDGIDASSGLEEYPGKKSAAKLERFFSEVESAASKAVAG